ncbi:MAG TPA: ABC transporter permease [Gemmatimonadales bacterium]|nr:ABC transporter permease [Gemmatimonadales bacterium]
MRRLALFLLNVFTPPLEREWMLGDTLEEFARIDRLRGRFAAHRWLWRELFRVLIGAPRHWLLLQNRPRPRPERRGDGILAALAFDIRYAIRVWRQSPGLTLTAVVILALGLGANTAMFAVVNGVLLKPLPFADPDRLMLVHLLAPDRDGASFREAVWSYPKYRSLLDVQTVFADVAAFGDRTMSLTDADAPERLRGEIASERYPGILGIAPVLGRVFTGEEANVAGTAPVVMIGEQLWRRRFGGDTSIIGRSISVDGKPHAVVGVLPRRFRGLSGQAEIWVPLAVYRPAFLTQRQNHNYMVVARRRDDVTEAQAVSAAAVIGRQLEAEYQNAQEDGRPWSAKAVSLLRSRADLDVRRTTLMLLGAVGFVLLIACVNLTTLVSAKALRRGREVAIRIALGASQLRIARQFIVESLVLSAAGITLGLGFAWLLLNTSHVLLPDADTFFRARDGSRPSMGGAAGLTQIGAAMIGLDGATLLFASSVALLCALLVAFLPALHGALQQPIDVLKAATAGMAGSVTRRFDIRSALVAAQVALALVLLAGAGLMLKSLWHLQSTSIGIDTDGVVIARLGLPGARYDAESSRAFYAALLERIRGVPGVQYAAFGNCPPASGGCSRTSILFDLTSAFSGRDPLVGSYWASPEYFSTLGIRLLRGRLFDDHDRAGRPNVVLINETAARQFWPNADPIGQIVRIGQGGFNASGAEVVGVVADVRYEAIESEAVADVYIPIMQSNHLGMLLFVRSRADLRTLSAAIRREVRALDPNLPVASVRTMHSLLGDAMWQTRVSAWLLSGFAALAMLLTVTGIFGVMAQTVTQRTPEFGIRMAIGADPSDVLRLVMRRALIISASGLVIGLLCAFALSKLVESLLYGVPSTDVTTYAAVAAILALATLTAAYVPARRATRIDAVAAIKAE